MKHSRLDRTIARCLAHVEEIEASQATARKIVARVMEYPTPVPHVPLVSPERAAEIREYYAYVCQLSLHYGLRLSTDGTFGIEDARNTLPAGYEYSAVIRSDDRLEIADYVEEESDICRVDG